MPKAKKSLQNAAIEFVINTKYAVKFQRKAKNSYYIEEYSDDIGVECPPRDTFEDLLAEFSIFERVLLLLRDKGESWKEIARRYGRSDTYILQHVAVLRSKIDVRVRSRTRKLSKTNNR